MVFFLLFVCLCCFTLPITNEVREKVKSKAQKQVLIFSMQGLERDVGIIFTVVDEDESDQLEATWFPN